MKLYQRPWKYAKNFGLSIIQNLKDRSNTTMQVWTNHCEYILAQRFRRGQQIAMFYYRIWDENAFKKLLQGFRRQAQRHIKGLVLSSMGVCVYDWHSERIQYESIKNYFNEIDFVQKLKQETLMCPLCKKRKVMSERYEGIEYCTCPDCNRLNKSENGWEPYLERKDMIVWRREERPALFAYKMHVVYNDVTADDFLHVQTDVEYRRKWDDTAISLEIVDTDPDDRAQTESHVIYWEMRWPRLFANRDYVYNRRHFIDTSRNLIVICNKSTQHPKCPVQPEKQRVENYWSYMVIRPFTTFKKPGLEFVLTYFDDPGLAIPSTITSWVAQKQMPDFLNKLYLATKRYADQRQEQTLDALASWESFKVKSEATYNQEKEKYRIPPNRDSNVCEDEETARGDRSASPEPETETRKTSWWSFFHLHSYSA